MIQQATALTQQIERALKEDERTQPYPIEVIDNDGVVTLKGTVPTEEVKTVAEELAGAQEDTLDVVSALTVDPSQEPVETLIVVPPRTPTGTVPNPPLKP
jgi:osmotically-inducible protein OsmY